MCVQLQMQEEMQTFVEFFNHDGTRRLRYVVRRVLLWISWRYDGKQMEPIGNVFLTDAKLSHTHTYTLF